MAEIDEYDEVWCVFDMDYKPDANGQWQDFDNAIKMAQSQGYKCAYSNDSFELWFVLHYQYLDYEHPSEFFNEILSNYWNINYERQGKK